MWKYIRALSDKARKLFSKMTKKKQLCPICRNVNPPQSTFCDFCGSPLTLVVSPPIETKVPDVVVGYVSNRDLSRKSEDNLVVLEMSSMYGLKPNKRILSVAVRGIEKIMRAKEIAKKLSPHMLLKEDEKTDLYGILSKFQEEAYNAILSKIGSESEAWAKIGLLASIIDGRQLIVSNIGKMSVYVISKEGIDQISGFIPRIELRAYALRLHKRSLNDGDYVLTCYDELAKSVGDEKIRSAVLEAESPQKACEELAKIAEEEGIAADFSIVVAQVI